MNVGYLGVGDMSRDVLFRVSSDVIETFTNMKVRKQANYSTHKIHGGKAVPEMTGMDADQITFDMILSAYMGVHPQGELDKLAAFMNDGTICSLVLGDYFFGTWVIKSVPFDIQYLYKEGDITQAKVSVTLLESAASTAIGTAAAYTPQAMQAPPQAAQVTQQEAKNTQIQSLKRRISSLEAQIYGEKNIDKRNSMIRVLNQLRTQMKLLGG